MLQLAKSKTLRIFAALVLLIALYALAGFVLAPKLLRSALQKDIPAALGASPTIGDIRVNPFLLELEVKNFSLTDPSGGKLLGFERLFVHFEFSSIWHRAYSFAHIDLAAPFVNAIVATDGRLNLMQLRPKSAPPAPAGKKDRAMPAVRIGSFKVSRGVIAYDDRSRPTAFADRLEPINFELMNFTTGADGGRFTFTGSSKLGERLEWHGHLSVQPIESDGEFQIDGLRAHTIWEYLEDRLNFVINSGSIDLNATYNFSLQDAVDFRVKVAKLAVSDLVLRPKDSAIDWVTVPGMLLSGADVDVSKHQGHADSLVITGAKLVTWFEPDGSINLLKLAAAAPPPSRPGASAPAPPAVPVSRAPASASSPWKFNLHRFELKSANISAEDRGTKPAAKFDLSALSLAVDGASLDLAKPVAVVFDTRINETGELSLSGNVTPQPLAADLGVKLGSIELSAMQPYLAQRTSMTLLAGKLSGEAKLRYGAKNPSLDLSGKFSVANLHTIDNALHDDFINWERLDVLGVRFQHDPDRLDVEQVVARKAYVRVIIEPDASLNVTRVTAGPGATLVAPSAAGGAATVIATAPLPVLVPADKSARSKAAPRASPPPSAGPSPPAGPAPMPVLIKNVAVHEGQVNFDDLSVTPNFAAGIQSLEGTILGVSSKANSRAKIDLHGGVDAYSPVTITGEANLLGTPLYADVVMNFRNVELSTFNPYSGKFAGYNITKGKLTTLLHYKIDGRKLDAQHHISIDQLEFGDKTASKDAVSLPVKLAVALLKDRHGVIDLDLPVTGSLDDPQFRIAPIIWKVFVHILERAVTAPFALLGRLFGGGPELQFIDFQPGTADLDSAGADKIKALVKALGERPQLKIEVPIAAVVELDRPALIDAKFSMQVRELPSEPAARLELLAPLYAKIVGGNPKYPDSIANLKVKPEIAAAKADFLTHELREHIVVGDAELTELGKQRAAAVQQAMLTDTQIDPERVFLVGSDKAKNENGKVRLELSLK